MNYNLSLIEMAAIEEIKAVLDKIGLKYFIVPNGFAKNTIRIEANISTEDAFSIGILVGQTIAFKISK